jgi:transcriptional regulator with XRE-family HTH domain
MATKKTTSKNVRPIAAFLRNGRLNAGLSQKQVADELGYDSVQFVSNWERGLRTPPGKTLLKLSKMYNISADALYEILLQERISKVEKELQKIFYG